MGTDRFSRHLPGSKPGPELWKLIPDANFSRNVSFHVIADPEGEHRWTGRYLSDLIEVLAISYVNGVLVEVDGELYHLVVSPAPKGQPHG